jgi:hypothetical protein
MACECLKKEWLGMDNETGCHCVGCKSLKKVRLFLIYGMKMIESKKSYYIFYFSTLLPPSYINLMINLK